MATAAALASWALHANSPHNQPEDSPLESSCAEEKTKGPGSEGSPTRRKARKGYTAQETSQKQCGLAEQAVQWVAGVGGPHGAGICTRRSYENLNTLHLYYVLFPFLVDKLQMCKNTLSSQVVMPQAALLYPQVIEMVWTDIRSAQWTWHFGHMNVCPLARYGSPC